MDVHGVGGKSGAPREIGEALSLAEKELKDIGKSMVGISKQFVKDLDVAYKKASSKSERKEIRAKRLDVRKQRKLLVKNLTSKKGIDYVGLEKQIVGLKDLMPEKNLESLQDRINVFQKDLSDTDNKISTHIRSLIESLKGDVRVGDEITSIFRNVFEGEVAGLEGIERKRDEERSAGYEGVLRNFEVLSGVGGIVISQREQLAKVRTFEGALKNECRGIEERLTKIHGTLVEKHKNFNSDSTKASRKIRNKKASLKDKKKGLSLLKKLSFIGKDAREIRALKKEIKGLEEAREKEYSPAVERRLKEEIDTIEQRLKEDISNTKKERGKIIKGRENILDDLKKGVEKAWNSKYSKLTELATDLDGTVAEQKTALEKLTTPTKGFIEEVVSRWELEL